MRLMNFWKTSGMAAMAASMVITPVAAQAQDGGQWRNRGERSAQHQQAQRQPEQRQVRQQQARPQSPRGERARPQEPRPQARPDTPRQQANRTGDRYADQVIRHRETVERAQNRNDRNERNDRRGNDRNWNDRNDRNDRGRDNDRWRDNNNRYQNNRPDYRRDSRQAQQRWDRNWRNDNRYDWNRYRQANRRLYSPGRYYAPYQNYSYRPLSIGIRLNSGFFGSRYVISDPWNYRLPQAYGPYRWVRYYDDVLLVDTYSGEVVDVIRNFFW